VEYNLGVMYETGDGIAKDSTQAAQWYRKAAEQGHALAQLNLGVMYFNGDVVPRDLVAACVWYNLAAAQGNDQAKKNRDMTEKQMTREQTAEA